MIEHRVRHDNRVSNISLDLCKKISDRAIFLLWRLVEKNEEDLNMVFIDLEKAYVKVLEEIISWVLEKKGS